VKNKKVITSLQTRSSADLYLTLFITPCQLLIPSPEDMKAMRTASHTKKINFSAEPKVLVFDEDGELEEPAMQRKDSTDLHAAHGLIRVYAGIWDLEVTYKCFLLSFPFFSILQFIC